MRKRKHKGRNLSGLLVLDKPVGITSNAALQQVKALYQASKAGHTGSLDPLASGMLIICFGEATKFSQYLLDADKTYEVHAKLGEKTTTGDAEGEIVTRQSVPTFSKNEIEKVLENFRGEIRQIPSMYSAIKYQGKPLYEYARAGIEVERQARPIFIYELVLRSIEKQECHLFVHCSKGTYIRTLIENIGDKLRCGAHVAGLRRLSIGKFCPNSMVSLSELQQQTDLNELDKILLPIHLAVANYPKVELSETAQFYLRQGNSIIVPKAPTSGMVQLVGKNDRFIGVGEILENGKVAPRKLYQG